MKKYIFVLGYLFLSVFTHAGEQYQLIRINQESLDQAIKIESIEACDRFKHNIAVASVTLATLVVIWYGYHACNPQNAETSRALTSLKEIQNEIELLKKGAHIASSLDAVSKDGESLFSHLINMPKKFIVGTGGFFADIAKWTVNSAPLFIGTSLLSSGYTSLQGHWNEAQDLKAFSGFVKHKTKVWPLCAILKDLAVPFDIYSERLSMDVNFGQRTLLLQEFMNDVTNAVQGKDHQIQQRFFALMRKNYLEQSATLQSLQHYALNALAQRQQVANGGVVTLIEIEHFNRKDIVHFCNVLILEIERSVAFVKNKTNKDDFSANYMIESSMDYLIEATNKFASKVEAKLALSLTELHNQSKQGQGLFDLIFDFTQQLESFDTRMKYVV